MKAAVEYKFLTVFCEKEKHDTDEETDEQINDEINEEINDEIYEEKTSSSETSFAEVPVGAGGG